MVSKSSDDIYLLSIGADPEFILCNEYGTPTPAIGKIGGTKKKPKDIGNGFYVQEDNVMAEMNIPVSYNKADFVDTVLAGLAKLRSLIPKGWFISRDSTFNIQEHWMSDDRALRGGCEPDLSPWTLDYNPRVDLTVTPLRSAGGHIHVAFNDPNNSVKASKLARAMDVFLTLPSILMDSNKERRKMYGKNGAFRYKKYGIEHRSLSNFWLFDERLIAWVWDAVELAVDWTNSTEDVPEDNWALMTTIINEGIEMAAFSLIESYNVYLPESVIKEKVKEHVHTRTNSINKD